MSNLVERAAPPHPPRASPWLAAPAPACALAAVALLLWGQSYPGFPFEVAGLVILATVVALVLTLLPRPRGRRTMAVVVAVAVVLGAGIVTSRLVGDNLLRVRWSESKAAFEAQVAALPSPTAYGGAAEDGSFREFPALCPAQLGRLRLSECSIIDGGYLFLQAPDALTDSSGIAYLPLGTGPVTSSLGSGGFTALGGPWWSWTCHC